MFDKLAHVLATLTTVGTLGIAIASTTASAGHLSLCNHDASSPTYRRNGSNAQIVALGGLDLAQKAMPVVARVELTDVDIKLMAVAFHYNCKTNIMDASGLQKSALYDARKGTQMLLIKPDAGFIDEVASQKEVGTNYMLLVVPAKLRDPQFSTLRQASQMGIQIAWGSWGLP